jgi:hypothetical protein
MSTMNSLGKLFGKKQSEATASSDDRPTETPESVPGKLRCSSCHQPCIVGSGEAVVEVRVDNQDKLGVDIGGKVRLVLISSCCNAEMREEYLDVKGRVEVDHLKECPAHKGDIEPNYVLYRYRFQGPNRGHDPEEVVLHLMVSCVACGGEGEQLLSVAKHIRLFDGLVRRAGWGWE